MKQNVLRGKIVEHEMTIGEFCEQAGISRSTFDRKMGGNGEFNRSEISRIISVLGLSVEEMRNIFFADEVT